MNRARRTEREHSSGEDGVHPKFNPTSTNNTHTHADGPLRLARSTRAGARHSHIARRIISRPREHIATTRVVHRRLVVAIGGGGSGGGRRRHNIVVEAVGRSIEGQGGGVRVGVDHRRWIDDGGDGGGYGGGRTVHRGAKTKAEEEDAVDSIGIVECAPGIARGMEIENVRTKGEDECE